MAELAEDAGPDFADQLLTLLDQAPEWPLPQEHKARLQAEQGRALRKGDREWLKRMHGWDLDRDYKVDSLAKRIAAGWADFLFADDITITAATGDEPANEEPDEETPGDAMAEAAQAEIDHIVEVNKLPALLHRAERKVISEGEAYWKLHVNRAIAEVPLITWCSRLETVPLFYGERLLAAAFVTVRARVHEIYQHGEEERTEVVYRHAEIHGDQRVVNVLYRGTQEQLGARVPLDRIDVTAEYAEEWRHGLPMLAGRVVNDLDDDDTQGVGDYDGIVDQLLDLNEAMTIAAENARLTGKDRIFAAGRFMQADGTFDASMEVFQVEQDDSALGEGDSKPPVVAIEKSYDAAPLWLHIQNLVKTALNRVGLVPQWIGEDVQGHGETGLAIRLRFIPTTNAAKGKLREWMHVIPRQIDLMLQVASLSIEEGGFGKDVAQVEPPAVEFGDPIPQDQSRDLLDVSAAVVSEVMSRTTAIATLHPEWDESQVEEEIARIDKDKEAGLLQPLPPPIKDVKPPGSARG
jgi:hypothetical protein